MRQALLISIATVVAVASSMGFDVVKRYEALSQFYRQKGFEDEAAWTVRRLEKIRRNAGS